jgi:hypothetical protein
MAGAVAMVMVALIGAFVAVYLAAQRRVEAAA